ncbi:endonuclease domain-containing protein [Candidatus Magnetaquicoccus inordinatus]|uniref:endonuclease domain-containing protein n=1 Tax=Candidatus Magnetaquicoccus inordinatus TaxID=2496818 RepID=UPI00102B5DAD|nr:endonuclease domain-containing protein [Candidatus Magnetaquicoccus inordinatus]
MSKLAENYQRFEFLPFESHGHQTTFHYRLSGDRVAPIDFCEQITWPAALPAPDPMRAEMQQALRNVQLVLGISYYKSCCPKEIIIHGALPNEQEAQFWDQLYTVGLGEFYYRNQLDPRGRVHFPWQAVSRPLLSCPEPVGEKVLLLIGGGKDSAVSYEIIREAGVEVALFSLGNAPWIKRLAAAFAAQHYVAGRQLDAKLFALNASGAYNGHIPISACIAFVSLVVALCGGYRAVIASNERTASYGNLHWLGMEINHQWSKSLQFEQSLQSLQRGLFVHAPDYFSLLRSLSELAICGLFARRLRYFNNFTSCNANFQLKDTSQTPRWCGRCPKCLFVYLMMAPHLNAERLQSIFAGDFLRDAANMPLLEELAGIRGHKPFECVGTPEEVLAALSQLYRQGRLQGSELQEFYEERLQVKVVDAQRLWQEQMAAGGESSVTPLWQRRLDDYLRAH